MSQWTFRHLPLLPSRRAVLWLNAMAKDDRKLVTRARIVDVAVQQFALRGFEGATVKTIAELAGVASATVPLALRYEVQFVRRGDARGRASVHGGDAARRACPRHLCECGA